MAPLLLPELLGGMVSSQVPFQLLKRLAAGLPGGADEVLELTRGLPHNVTTEMDLELWRVALAIRADPASLAACRAAGPEGLARRMLAGSLPGPAAAAVSASSPEAVFARGAQRAAAAADRIVNAMRETKGPAAAALARFLAGRVRELSGLRESPKFGIIRVMSALRAAVLARGTILAAEGVLERADDLFFLKLDEIASLSSRVPGAASLAGRGSGTGQTPARGPAEGSAATAAVTAALAAAIAAARAARTRETRRRRLPRLIAGGGESYYDPPLDPGLAGGRVHKGSPVSPGVAEGRARIVHDPGKASLEPGDILVCRGTDPAWTPLFMVAGGLVTEVGGEMTHGSVVAREYGIPAVVGVASATMVIPEGARVRIDGSSGLVLVLDPL
jgi:phosphohistidine swiveling domain-containing protein